MNCNTQWFTYKKQGRLLYTLKTFIIATSIQPSAEVLPNVRHSFGESAQTFGFGVFNWTPLLWTHPTHNYRSCNPHISCLWTQTVYEEPRSSSWLGWPPSKWPGKSIECQEDIQTSYSESCRHFDLSPFWPYPLVWLISNYPIWRLRPYWSTKWTELCQSPSQCSELFSMPHLTPGISILLPSADPGQSLILSFLANTFDHWCTREFTDTNTTLTNLL